MSNAIDYERASIHAVEHRIGKSGVTSRVKVVAIATAKIARAVGARWLLDKDALVKDGFNSVELLYELKNVRLKHAIEKVASLELVCETINKFKVFRKGDDKKKAKRLMVSFVAHSNGSPFELLEYLMKAGEGEGVCTLIPLQQEMFPDAAKETRPKGRQLTLAAAVAPRPTAAKKSAPVAKKPAATKKTSVKKPPEAKARPLAPNVANEHGVFASAKPVEQYKGSDRRFYATLSVVEVEQGYVAGYDVHAGHSAAAASPSASGPYYGNRAEALAAGAAVVIIVASRVAHSGIRSHKREAEKMVTWAQKFGEPAVALKKTTPGKASAAAAAASPSPAEDRELFGGLADAPPEKKTGKDAAYPD